MTACATACVTSANANQKARNKYFAPPRLDIRRNRIPEQACQHRRPNQPYEKSDTPPRIFLRRAQQATEDAADASDTSVE
jgi:hypothetical protein